MTEAYGKNNVHPLRNMRNHKRPINSTEFIVFSSADCRGCWNCIAVCPENVFGKINIIIHKHALIKNGGDCSGCGKCIKSCPAGAIIYKINSGEIL